MRKFLIAAAVATSAIAAATPAAAQYYPAPQQGYGYGQPNYGYGYGQRLSYDQSSRNYRARTDQLRQRIERLDSRDRISEREARWLRSHAIDLQQRARAYTRNGLNSWERRDLDNRIAWLQQHIRADVRDGNRYGYSEQGQWRDYDRDGIRDNRDRWVDRDRDGRDDRYERRRDRDRDDD